VKQTRQHNPTKPVVRLASHSRGRLRVRVGRGTHREKLLARIKEHLQAQPGVSDVDIHPATGSAVVTYDHNEQSGAGILRLMGDLDVVVASFHPSPDDHAVDSHLGLPSVTEAIDDLDQYLHETMGVRVNLRMAVPLGLLAIGVWSVAKRGLMIDSVPGWVFLWLAFDTFVKLHWHPELLTPGTAAIPTGGHDAPTLHASP